MDMIFLEYHISYSSMFTHEQILFKSSLGYRSISSLTVGY
ncbi:hypothetical protein BSBH6_00114 [Bacillus subtilis]|nr:hypothetical protein BSBH6_00114 [Bacillus subtilis]RPK26477.1 hypothetical protein BH5_00112 [Bacillus subtilis]